MACVGIFLWVCVSVASEIGWYFVECVGVFFMGVCRLLRNLVGSLWDVSVCFLRVCVSVAWEIGR